MQTVTQKPQYIELDVQGMTCTNCALSIEKYLKAEGLSDVQVDFSNAEVSFELIEEKKLPSIIKGINKLGYKVREDKDEKDSNYLERLFYFCLLFSLPLFLHMFLPIPLLHNPYFQALVALPVYLAGAVHFGRSAWHSLTSGVPNMDVLIIIGATAAFAYSLYGTFAHAGPEFLFYETAAGIITLVLLGNLIEQKAVRRTSTSLQALKGLQQQKAKRMNPATQNWEPVDIKLIRKEDLLLIGTGDRIPVDGEVHWGQAEVDESMLTGESLPVGKQVGSQLIGGTLLVEGIVQMKAKKLGKETLLSQIIEIVKRAQAEKPDIQQLADKISAIFVPAVISIALIVFLVSYLLAGISFEKALIHSVAVLVIACPCAMGLATPTAVVVGIGRASKNGILIKGGRTLEQFFSVKQIVFDKTGTLTTGKFALQQVHCHPEEQAEIEQIAAAIAIHSSHPLAISLAKALPTSAALAFANVREMKGLGMEAVDDKQNCYMLGSYKILGGQIEDPSHNLYLTKNGHLWAAFDLSDEIRVGAVETIQFLKDRGITPILLSGDKEAHCIRVADALGISKVYAEQSPEEKLNILDILTKEGPTAMVGDGVNDAPALTKATVGISLGNATEAAIQSSQIVLLQDNISRLQDLYKIGKHTVLTIRQNLFWAFFYNVLAIPLAAVGLLSPLIGAFTMALSDVVVIGNSLRLRIKPLKM